MSYEADAHEHQMTILKHLLLRLDAGFSELQKTMAASSDAANFHIKQLVRANYITKNGGGRYTLTPRGKEYANRMDTEERVIEKQAKVAACLMIRRSNGTQLVQQRLKQPYYGYWGRPTGKVRWGETILEGAARELMEETGLTADMTFESVFHKMDYNKATGELLEDKIFFIVAGTNVRGELIEEFEGGRNAWMTPEEYAAQPLTFASTNQLLEANSALVHIAEDRLTYEPGHY